MQASGGRAQRSSALRPEVDAVVQPVLKELLPGADVAADLRQLVEAAATLQAVVADPARHVRPTHRCFSASLLVNQWSKANYSACASSPSWQPPDAVSSSFPSSKCHTLFALVLENGPVLQRPEPADFDARPLTFTVPPTAAQLRNVPDHDRLEAAIGTLTPLTYLAHHDSALRRLYAEAVRLAVSSLDTLFTLKRE